MMTKVKIDNKFLEGATNASQKIVEKKLKKKTQGKELIMNKRNATTFNTCLLIIFLTILGCKNSKAPLVQSNFKTIKIFGVKPVSTQGDLLICLDQNDPLSSEMVEMLNNSAPCENIFFINNAKYFIEIEYSDQPYFEAIIYSNGAFHVKNESNSVKLYKSDESIDSIVNNYLSLLPPNESAR